MWSFYTSTKKKDIHFFFSFLMKFMLHLQYLYTLYKYNVYNFLYFIINVHHIRTSTYSLTFQQVLNIFIMQWEKLKNNIKQNAYYIIIQIIFIYYIYIDTWIHNHFIHYSPTYFLFNHSILAINILLTTFTQSTN